MTESSFTVGAARPRHDDDVVPTPATPTEMEKKVPMLEEKLSKLDSETAPKMTPPVPSTDGPDGVMWMMAEQLKARGYTVTGQSI